MAENKKPAEKPAAQTQDSTGGGDLAAKQKWPLWKKVVVVLGVGFVLLIVFAYFFTRGASEAAGKFIDDLQAGNCSEAWSQTAANFRTQTSEQEWNTACETIGPILQGEESQTNVEVSTGTNEETIGMVDYDIPGTDGLTYEVSVQLIQQDGDWKVSALNSEVKGGGVDIQ